MKLYELTASLQAAIATADDAGGEITPELQAVLDALEGDLSAKVEAVVKYIRNLEASSAALKEEAGRFAVRAQADGSRADGLKAYVKIQLELVGLTRVEAGLFKVRVQRNGQPSVTCDVPVDSLPPSLVKREEVVTLDTKAVVAAAQAGFDLPAGVSVKTGSHLRIS